MRQVMISRTVLGVAATVNVQVSKIKLSAIATDGIDFRPNKDSIFLSIFQ